MQFLADESCDFTVVRALRVHGHDVSAIADTSPGADDDTVLGIALAEGRVVLTEDKDFGNLAYHRGRQTAGVVLIRFPADAREGLGDAVIELIADLGDRVSGAFVVLEPGRARLSRPSGGRADKRVTNR